MSFGPEQESPVVTYTITGAPTEDSGIPYAKFTMSVSQYSGAPSHDGIDYKVQALVDALSSVWGWNIVAVKSGTQTWAITPTS